VSFTFGQLLIAHCVISFGEKMAPNYISWPSSLGNCTHYPKPRSIDKYKKELIAVEEEIVPKEDYKRQLLELTSQKIEQDYSDRQAQISLENNEQTSVIQDRINNLRASIQSEYTLSLKQQISDIKSQIESLKSQRDTEIDRLYQELQDARKGSSEEISIRRRSLQGQLQKAEANLQRARGERSKAIEEANIFTRANVTETHNLEVKEAEREVEATRNALNSINAVEQSNHISQRYSENIAAVKSQYQSKINGLNGEIRKLSLSVSKSVGVREKDIETQINQHLDEMKAVNAKFSEQRSENDGIRDQQLERLNRNEELVEGVEQEILTLKERRVDLRNKINIKVGDNQVYRMAQWWFGKESAADLDRSDVMIIAAIWFGSLAVLIAFTGILLALGSYVIRDRSIKDQRTKSSARHAFTKAIDSARRYYVHKRKVVRKPIINEVPVEVVREVPVDKVVQREVPVEIIKKELVHVPFYTNDERLLKTQADVDLSSKPSKRPMAEA
ncbi:hypothetical protein KOI40_13095, partial [Aestuariicella sp. G3-2]|uniref:hypothetical protein n=1 Tax=Pseudomaricurvus albidus TaxID=2842452 RepID=UPI001C0B2C1A